MVTGEDDSVIKLIEIDTGNIRVINSFYYYNFCYILKYYISIVHYNCT